MAKKSEEDMKSNDELVSTEEGMEGMREKVKELMQQSGDCCADDEAAADEGWKLLREEAPKAPKGR